eukprot:TRINITY_DN421_c0_g2_i1.p1 TRINITY_DN421_c0_g2~~TRINITY_DN421_c0_g2_i1.p1  ORF type:complete len:166 (+),score=50.66 TRINITY_DN421_c0_g2_i1:31-528(+)
MKPLSGDMFDIDSGSVKGVLEIIADGEIQLLDPVVKQLNFDISLVEKRPVFNLGQRVISIPELTIDGPDNRIHKLEEVRFLLRAHKAKFSSTVFDPLPVIKIYICSLPDAKDIQRFIEESKGNEGRVEKGRMDDFKNSIKIPWIILFVSKVTKEDQNLISFVLHS